LRRITRLKSFRLELLVANGGPRLRPSAGDPGKPAPGGPRPTLDAKGFPVLPPGMRNIASQPAEDGERVTRAAFRDYSMEELAQNLSWPLGSPVWEHVLATGRVVNKTGLAGRYDFTLEYAGTYYPGGAFPAPRADGQAGRFLSLFDAVQQQLGLKLRETRVPTDVLVVDHADRTPTGN